MSNLLRAAIDLVAPLTLAQQLRQDAEDGRSPLLGHLHVENERQLQAAETIEALVAYIRKLSGASDHD